MNIYWNSFRTFFRIGLFTIGGGYAMIPLIEADVVDKNKWVAREDFLDLMAIAQSCPGIFAVNMSIFIGYKLKGVPGSGYDLALFPDYSRHSLVFPTVSG